MQQVNMLEAKTRLSELVKSAQAGEDVIIANRGEPVARLVAVRKRGRKRVQAKVGTNDVLAWLSSHPVPAHAKRLAAQIDAAIAAERDGWE